MPDQTESKQPPKRRVKNPETFRERAFKAAASDEKPRRAVRLKQALVKTSHPVLSPVYRGLVKLFRVPPFSWLAKLLYWIGLIIVPSYFRNSWRELRLVAWPTRRQSRQLTFAVLAFAIVFGSSVALVDFGLDKLFRNILLK